MEKGPDKIEVSNLIPGHQRGNLTMQQKDQTTTTGYRTETMSLTLEIEQQPWYVTCTALKFLCTLKRKVSRFPWSIWYCDLLSGGAMHSWVWHLSMICWQVYQTPLEDVDFTKGFSDFCSTFELQRGKDEEDEESSIVGEFKVSSSEILYISVQIYTI